MLGDKLVGLAADAGDDLVDAEAIRRAVGGAKLELFAEPGDADLEKLVKIGAGDAEKAEPLEEGEADVSGLFKDAAVEREKTQLAVEVEAGGAQIHLSVSVGYGEGGYRGGEGAHRKFASADGRARRPPGRLSGARRAPR